MLAEGARQYARDLGDVRKVVRGPAGDQLLQRHRPELRMFPAELELRAGHIQAVELLDVREAKPRELPDQCVRSPSAIPPEAFFTIEGRKASAAVEDAVDPRHPVGDLRIAEVAQHFGTGPGAFGFAPCKRFARRGRDQSLDDPRSLE